MANRQPISQGSRPAHPPVLVRITQLLFLLNAVIWIVLGVIYLRDMAAGVSSGWVVALLMFGNAAVLAGLGWALGTQRWWFYYLALLVLLVNIVLGVADDIGLADVLVLCLNTVMLVLLFIKRAWYTANR